MLLSTLALAWSLTVVMADGEEGVKTPCVDVEEGVCSSYCQVDGNCCPSDQIYTTDWTNYFCCEAVVSMDGGNPFCPKAAVSSQSSALGAAPAPEVCQKKTYSLYIPEETAGAQTYCKGGSKKVSKQNPCTSSNTCTAEECRVHCDKEPLCNFYTSHPSGKCMLYKSCSKKENGSTAAAVYAKVCSDFSGSIGVSWSDFTLERWQTDSAAITAAVEAEGGMVINKDAGNDATQQSADIEALVDLNIGTLIVIAVDASALGPALEKAFEKGIPVIAYDRLIDDERAFYLTFDNVEVGRLQAQAILDVQPTGKYVFIKGSETDPNAHFVRQGQQEVLQAAIDASDITIVDEAFTPGWNPDAAETNFRNIMTAASDDVDAIVASNDGTAGAVHKVLTEKGLVKPLSGQDGDKAALNRVAKGEQTVSVWKDARELGKSAGEIAVMFAQSFNGFLLMKKAVDYAGGDSFTFVTPSGKTVYAMLLPPVAITQDNLSVVVDANWITVAELCSGVTGGSVAACPAED